MARILVFDIESTNLKANFGSILCVGYKFVGQRSTHVPSILDYHDICNHCDRIEDPENDRELLKEFSRVYNSADIVVSWYGKGFDVPFIQTRLLFHKLPPLSPVPHVDGCRDIAQKYLKLHSNRLGAVQEFLDLPNAKTPLASKEWNLARAGKKRGLKYVIEHCKQDVLVLEEAYLKLRNLMPRHPNVGLLHQDREACPFCGGSSTHARGTYVSGSREYQRYQCQRCGGWFKKPKATRSGTLGL